MAKYLMIFSHCIIQFCEFGFCFSLQSELFIDEINWLLSFLCPLDLSFLELLYCQVVSLSLSVNAALGQPQKQIATSGESKYKKIHYNIG